MKSLKESFNKVWEPLPPNQKRIAVIAGALGLLSILVVLGLPADESSSSYEAPKVDDMTSILTEANTRELGIDSVSAEIRNLKHENRKTTNALDKAKREQNQQAESSRTTIKALQSELYEMKRELSSVKAKQQSYDAQPQNTPFGTKDMPTGYAPYESENSSIFESKPQFLPANEQNKVVGRADIEKEALPSIRVITDEASDNGEEERDDPRPYLSTGSILTGYLITGVDAPTSESTKSNPFPALIRVKKEAVLPNYYRMDDVRECFLTAGGYGDMSSERAYFRGETLSCVREDGSVIETKLESYLAGEDGKAGLKGRLVSKQGTMLARSMMAGFAEGVSKAFDVNPVPVLSTGTDGQQQYNQVMSSEAIQGAGIKGLSNSMQRLADFYIDLADRMHPVIEITAGRSVEVIVTKGTKL